MKRAFVLVVLGIMLAAIGSRAQCPAAGFNLGGCTPVAWTLHTAMIEYAPRCTVEVVYCQRWICAGNAPGINGPRHQISLSTFRTVPNPAEAPDDCPAPINPLSPTLAADMDAFIGSLVRTIYEQAAFNQQTPVLPCGTDPTVYFEVLSSACVAEGTWSGTCDFADQIPSVTVNVTGWSLKFCGGGSINCVRTYKLCDDPNPPNARTMTVVDRKLRDNTGNIIIPTPTPTQLAAACNNTTAGTFPGFVNALGEGNLAAQGYPITTTAQNATVAFGCDGICN
jgi:hypothetical protein